MPESLQIDESLIIDIKKALGSARLNATLEIARLEGKYHLTNNQVFIDSVYLCMKERDSIDRMIIKLNSLKK